jgi:MFS family permease
VRAGLLLLDFVAALILLRDIGFTPSPDKSLVAEVRAIARASLRYGLGNPAARWLMLASPFSAGVSMYGFYAMQPYLLDLHGDRAAYGIAGLSAAIFAGAQIAGGLLVPHVLVFFRRRTSLLLLGTLLSTVFLFALGPGATFGAAIVWLVSWGLVFAAITPARQALLNGLIPSQQRATVLSFDSLLASSGGVVIQPVLGRVADLSGYPASYVVGAAFQVLALPLLWLARRERPDSDTITEALPRPKI